MKQSIILLLILKLLTSQTLWSMNNQFPTNDHETLNEQLDKLSLSPCICKNKPNEGAFHSAMLHAVKNNCLSCVKKLSDRVDINQNLATKNEPPRTYLFIACENSYKEIIEYLLEKKAQTLLVTDHHQYGALNYLKNIELVQLLVKAGADINQEIRHFGTLHFITNKKNCKSSFCDCGETPLFFFVFQKNDSYQIQILLKIGAHFFHVLNSGNNIIHAFAQRVTKTLESFRTDNDLSNLYNEIRERFLFLKETCFEYDTHYYTKDFLNSLCKTNSNYRSIIILILLIKKRIPYINAIPFIVLSQKIFSQLMTIWEILLTAPNKDNQTALQLLEKNTWLYEKIKDLL